MIIDYDYEMLKATGCLLATEKISLDLKVFVLFLETKTCTW